MNVGVVGTQKMNPALKNRMNKVIKFEAIEKSKQEEIIMKESGLNDRPLVKKMIEAGNAIRKKLKDESIDNATISIRNLINWAKDIRDTNDIIESSKSTVIWAVCVEDEDVQDEILKDIIEPRFKGYKVQ
jgi:MoxR-like ATPase